MYKYIANVTKVHLSLQVAYCIGKCRDMACHVLSLRREMRRCFNQTWHATSLHLSGNVAVF
ncbi:MAG: hypothetical protein HDS84_03780 [Bacteroidales bacterium]|nr:hypothetical protein [Bacteroidales bacterium]MBD5302445.1 hypothetical protein [Bacteroides sp.]